MLGTYYSVYVPVHTVALYTIFFCIPIKFMQYAICLKRIIAVRTINKGIAKNYQHETILLLKHNNYTYFTLQYT